MSGKINVNFDFFKENYPDFISLAGKARTMADDYKNRNPKWTSCVIQMSVALNTVQQLIPKVAPNGRVNDFHQPFYYMLAVHDFRLYLASRYGAGEEINGSPEQKKQALANKQGILTMGDDHTELWDNDHNVQNGVDRKARMSPAAVLGSNARTLFWEISAGAKTVAPVPIWLPGWWEVNDGETYYYYFTKTHTVTYTKVKPKNIAAPAIETLTNGGAITMHPNGATIIINWNPVDGGNTIETFTRVPSTVESMAGQSNRYGPLKAVKMT